MLRIIGLVGLFTALCGGQAFSQVTLEAKYVPETKSVSESTIKSNQTLTLAGMDIETKSSTFTVVTKSIGKRDGDGLLPVQEKVDVLQTDIEIQGMQIKFDSSNPEKKADIPQLEPLLERLRVSFKTPVTTILDAKNKIKEIKFPDGVVDSLDPSNKSLFDADKRKKTAEQARGYLPDEAVKPGATWERSLDVDLGGGQTMGFRVKYTYDGTVEKDGKSYDKITGKVFEISYSVDQSAPVGVSKSDLKPTESLETVLFDREAGQVQEKTSKTRIQGPLTLVIGGAEIEGKVDLTIEENTKRQK